MQLNGYGRQIQNNGSYYIGMFKDNVYDGEGELILEKSKIQGTWKQGKI